MAITTTWVTISSVQSILSRLGLDLMAWADSDIEDLILIAQQEFERRTNRSFEFASKTVNIDGSGKDSLVIPDYPIIDLTSVNILGGSIASQSLTPSDIVIDNDRGIIFQSRDSVYNTPYSFYGPVIWPHGNRNIQLTYTHGYNPGPAPANDFPADILYAIRLMSAIQVIVQTPSASQKRGLKKIKILDYTEEFGKGGIYGDQINAWSLTIDATIRTRRKLYMGTP